MNQRNVGQNFTDFVLLQRSNKMPTYFRPVALSGVERGQTRVIDFFEQALRSIVGEFEEPGAREAFDDSVAWLRVFADRDDFNVVDRSRGTFRRARDAFANFFQFIGDLKFNLPTFFIR